MRPTLTVASSLTPHEHWLSNVSMPTWMVPGMIHLIFSEIAQAAGENERVTGVAVVIRVPGAPRAEDALLAWEWRLDPPGEYRRAVVVPFCRPSEAPHADV